MKIAITSTGETLDSPVDPRFGRAAWFIIVDSDSMEFEAIANDNVGAAGGAGISSAKVVIDAGAEAVLTGNCGPNAHRSLAAGGVKVYTGAAGTVKEAVEKFNSGELTAADGPSVGSHFGTGI
ncbi:MAG: dinitrogenase iron-molybdenum cofactor biosynthesis protein [Planctomycetota bacterium]|nr:MAG: dinitrogenase iron-molybdenum cofactor biosynthesis protein [Planctomycetota bacterium]